MILMIDNYDSFTYNVVQYVKELGFEIKVIRNDELSLEEIEKLGASKIIISPGPSNPNNAGICLDLISYFQDKIPLLGICLGHQAIGQVFGAKIVQAKNIMHGKISQIDILDNNHIFKNIPQYFNATRYHSLVIDKNSINEHIQVSAKSTDDDEIMAIKIKNKNIFGIQFHLESIMSEYGKDILQNFLNHK